MAAPPATNRPLVLVESLDDAADAAWRFARRVSSGEVRAIHVPTGRTDPGIRGRWSGASRHRSSGSTARTASPKRCSNRSGACRGGESDFVTVYVPELFDRPSLRSQFERPRELALKFRLLGEPGVVVATVPVVKDSVRSEPKRVLARVLVSGINAASMRAVNYASTLEVDDVRAVHFAFGPDDAAQIREEWTRNGARVELEIAEAPYRDLGRPLLDYLRGLTVEPDTVVLVLMPELVTRGWRRVLHNQRAVYVKRLLLFEPRVVLAAVPYRLLR